MITEGYFAKIADYPESDYLVAVSLMFPKFVDKDRVYHASPLAPPSFLYKQHRYKEVTWERYESHYRSHLAHNELGQQNLDWLIEQSKKGRTMRLLCWERAEYKKCHRFILLDILKERGAEVE